MFMAFGEPLRKNKTFFFAAFQQNTFHSTRNYSFVVPTADSAIRLSGLFPSNPRLDLYLSAGEDDPLTAVASTLVLPLEAQAELNQPWIKCIADLAHPALVKLVFR